MSTRRCRRPRSRSPDPPHSSAAPTPMIVAHVLCPGPGRPGGACGAGLGARDRRPAPGGLSAFGPVRVRAGLPARGAPAEQSAGSVVAPAVRAGRPRQPAAGLDDLHDGGLHLHLLGHPRPQLVAGLRNQRLLHHHHGLLGAQRAGADLDRLRGGDDRTGPRRPPHQLPAHHLRGLQRPREGHEPAPSHRRVAAQRPGVPADAGPYRRPGDPRHLAERRRLDARPRADPHRLPDPHLFPRLRQRAIVGRHHGDGARRVGAGLRRL